MFDSLCLLCEVTSSVWESHAYLVGLTAQWPGMGNPQLSVSEKTFPGVLSPGTSSKVPWAGGLQAGLPALWTQWEEGQSACWSVGWF